MMLSVFTNVVVMMVYLSFGYILCKTKLGHPSHAKTLSGLLIYILGPCMILNSFLSTEYSLATLLDIGGFFLATLVTQSLFFAVVYLIFHRKYEDAKYRIMSAAAVLGNVGFFGIPLISSIYPEYPIVTCYCSMHVMSMNLLVFTMGTYLITNDRKYISLKGAIFNPTTFTIVLSLPLFILNVQLPDALNQPLGLLAKMVTPVCMIILGMRLSLVTLKDLLGSKVVYLACFLKLIAYPMFVFLCTHILPLGTEMFRVSIFVLATAPAGAIIESLAELHECEQEISAKMVLLTTIFSTITIPIILGLCL